MREKVERNRKEKKEIGRRTGERSQETATKTVTRDNDNE